MKAPAAWHPANHSDGCAYHVDQYHWECTCGQFKPASEARLILEWLRRDVGPEAIRMMLAAGLPGGTRTQRTKNAAFAEGCAHAVKMIADGIERGDYGALA